MNTKVTIETVENYLLETCNENYNIVNIQVSEYDSSDGEVQWQTFVAKDSEGLEHIINFKDFNDYFKRTDNWRNPIYFNGLQVGEYEEYLIIQDPANKAFHVSLDLQEVEKLQKYINEFIRRNKQ